MRGIASVSVAWFHFTKNNPALSPDSFLHSSGKYGWLGVQVFFVVSGFVIPWALARVQFQWSDFGHFLLRRMVRLDPPYIVAIAITVVMGYLSAASPDYRGHPYHVTLPQILSHLAFLNVFTGHPWINEVFWTLAIEFQFYILLGAAFPLLFSRRGATRTFALLALGVMAIAINVEGMLFPSLFVFLSGILTCQMKLRLVSPALYALGLATAFAGNWAIHGLPIALAAIATAAAIALWDSQGSSLMSFFGRISYPLYLLHGPVGGRVINLASRYRWGYSNPLLVLVGAMVAATTTAYLVHRVVEVPARRLASSIRYRGRFAPVAESASL